MKTAKIRVVLADEFPIVLTGLRALLGRPGDIEVVGETGHGHDLAALVERVAPDVLVVDARMALGVDLSRLRAAAVRVLVLSRSEDQEEVTAKFSHDALGFLTKDVAVESILAAVRRVARGETGWFSCVEPVAEGISYATLTPREMAVLWLVVDGKTNHEIGVALGISDKTVEKRITALFDKLAVESRVEAAVLAVQQGLV